MYLVRICEDGFRADGDLCSHRSDIGGGIRESSASPEEFFFTKRTLSGSASFMARRIESVLDRKRVRSGRSRDLQLRTIIYFDNSPDCTSTARLEITAKNSRRYG